MPRQMPPEVLELVADRFKILGDPARLRILSRLTDGEQSVSQIVDDTGLSQANASKHLALLYSVGFVRRRKERLFTYYALADKAVLRLCDLMCGRIESEVSNRAKMLAK